MNFVRCDLNYKLRFVNYLFPTSPLSANPLHSIRLRYGSSREIENVERLIFLVTTKYAREYFNVEYCTLWLNKIVWWLRGGWNKEELHRAVKKSFAFSLVLEKAGSCSNKNWFLRMARGEVENWNLFFDI